MPRLTPRPVLLLLSLLSLAASARAATLDVEIPHHRGDYYDKAAFRLWLPEDQPGPVSGVVVLLDGINVDGRHRAERKQWRNFAREHSLALVACWLATDIPGLANYCQAEHGGGQALLEALKQFGEANGHPEFDTVPLMLIGFSAGGQFSYSFACFRPDRVAAFVCNKGGVFDTRATAASREVPGIIVVGANDLHRRRKNALKLYQENRKLGARWCLAIEPKKGHTNGNVYDIALPFFAAALRLWQRPALERAGIVLDLDHRRFISPGVPPKDAGMTFWFPDEEIVKVWNKFVSTPR